MIEKINDLITICIVNYNSSDFIINTLYCLKKLTKNQYKVIIRDNNSDKADFLYLKKEIKNFPNVELYRIENFKEIGSIAHGIAINDLINKINTKYGVILDADCTFLIKNWDEYLINQINEEYPIIGTQAVPGYYSKRASDFPLAFAVLFRTDILKKLNIDFMCKNPSEGLDTGYQLREKYLAQGYLGKILIGKNTREYKKGPFSNIICEEYYLDGFDNIFASHFGRGSTLGKAKYIIKKSEDGKIKKKKLLYTFPLIGNYFLTSKGKKEKKDWIKICKSLIN